MTHLYLLLLLLAAPAAKPPPEARVPPEAKVPVETIDATVSRAERDAFVAGGPQRLVAAVEVRPYFQAKKFKGFRLLRFVPGGLLADATSLQPEDVVLAVNREPIERPEQFMRAWEAARTADLVEIHVLRGDRRLLFRWKIAG